MMKRMRKRMRKMKIRRRRMVGRVYVSEKRKKKTSRVGRKRRGEGRK